MRVRRLRLRLEAPSAAEGRLAARAAAEALAGGLRAASGPARLGGLALRIDGSGLPPVEAGAKAGRAIAERLP